MKTLFIYNPNAGQKQIKNYLYEILNVLSRANYDLTVYPTKKINDATNYVKKNCNKYDLIICSGGDGTLNETITGMLNSKINKLPNLGYIPAGTTNDFAGSIKIPKNMIKAAELVTKGNPRKYDIGKFNSKFFVYIAAFGIFTKVSYETPQDIKNIFGHLAYVIEGIKSIKDIRSYYLKIKSEDIKIEGKFIYGMITNTYSIGGVYKLNKKLVQLDDGQFEVMLVRQPKDPIELAEINSFLLGTIKHTDMVITFKTKELSIETKDDMAWTLDGEYGGNPKKIKITNIQKCINIISKNDN